MGYKSIIIGLSTVLFAVLSFYFTSFYIKLTSIETSLANLQIDLVKIQSNTLTESRVKELIRYEVGKYHLIQKVEKVQDD